MNITEITKQAGAHRRRKRVGRGEGSGLGKTSGRGNKGSGARAGWQLRLLREGGQMPTFRRTPKRGFSNVQFRTVYQVVNVGSLETRFEPGAHVTASALAAAGLIRCATDPVKILAGGELTRKLTVEAQRFSADAAKKIEAAGGTIKRLGPQPKPKFVKRPPAPAAAADEGKPAKKDKAKPEKKPKGDAPKGDAGGAPEGGEA